VYFEDLNESAAYSKIVDKLRQAGCVFAEEEAGLLISSARTPQELAVWLERRIAGFPLEHLIGWVEFCGLRIKVDPGVFVPRPRTEFLARQAIALARPGDVVVDMCCGAGALGAAVAAELERIELHAVDIDPAAVQCARRNIRSGEGTVYEGNLYEPLPARLHNRVNILIANAPYVPTEAIKLLPQEARIHESVTALDGGTDGLDVLRKIVAAAPSWLAEGGRLLVETSARQALLAAELFSEYGLHPATIRSEDQDATVIIGTRTDPERQSAQHHRYSEQ
jgi:release factor glutamine methyltransferase